MDFSLLFAQIKIVMPFAQTHSKKLYRGSTRLWLTPPQRKSPGGISEAVRAILTSSLRTPKLFIKEFGDFLMSCHQHCLGVNLLVQR